MPWGVAAAVVGGVISSQASKSAANKQAESADKASQAQASAAAQTRQDLNPWRYAGGNALSKMQQMTGTGVGSSGGGMPNLYETQGDSVVANPQLYASDPAYRKAWDASAASHQAQFGKGYTLAGGSDVGAIQQSLQNQLGAGWTGGGGAAQPYNFVDDDPGARYRLQQAEMGTNRAAAARGLGNSGNILQELSRINSEQASQEFGNSFNRLAGMSQAGQMAANQTSNFGTSAANQIGQNTMAAGSAQAGADMAQGKAWNTALGQGTNWWQQNNAQNNNADQQWANNNIQTYNNANVTRPGTGGGF
jgi:hypothetical protein